MTFPSDKSNESPGPLVAAASNAPRGEMADGLSELIRVMKIFRELTATIIVDKPWLSPNAAQLDSMTFKDWVHNATTNSLAREVMVIAGSELGAIAEPWWASALHVARQQAAAPQIETPEKWLIKGAAGQIPGLLATNITRGGGKILLGMPGRLIQQDGKSIVGE
jgi:monoamine oxidase